jgi:hypothetical protein
MPTITIKNFRFFRITANLDLYDMLSNSNILLSLYEQETSTEHIYFNKMGFVEQKGIFDLEVNSVSKFAQELNCHPNLILGLLNSANDEDDDPLYEWIEEKGGKTEWFDLIENPEFKEMNALSQYDDTINVLCSEGEITIDRLEKNGIYLNNKLIFFEEIFGYYDETKEFLLTYISK